jgi:hypothetical protein
MSASALRERHKRRLRRRSRSSANERSRERTTCTPPLPEHITYDTMNHDDTLITSSEHHGELNLQQEPDQNDMIGRLAHKLGVSRDAYMDWEEETERVLVQGEYLQPIYPTPTPAPPPPAPWYPPQPLTSDYQPLGLSTHHHHTPSTEPPPPHLLHAPLPVPHGHDTTISKINQVM